MLYSPGFTIILNPRSQVYYEVPELQQTKTTPRVETRNETPEQDDRIAHNSWPVQTIIQSILHFGLYFRHPALLPSFAGALLYLTVLSFAGQMVTYLLSAGYNATQIGIARNFSVASEVLATWLAPWLIGKFGPIRAGIWLASSQMACLVAGITVFWALLNRPSISASALVGATILSRLGLRGFDLCIQIIIQEVSQSYSFLHVITLQFHHLRNSLESEFPGQAPRLIKLYCHIGR